MLKGHTAARLALAFSFATLASAQTFGIEHYAKIARVTDPHMAPDGRSVVLVVARPNYQDDKWDSELVQIDLATHRARELTHQRQSARFPRWSPSGDKLAFLADSAGQSQIFVLETDGGEANQITHAPTGVQAFAWKPNGSAFAYMSRDEAPKREKFDDSFEVEANDYLMQAGTQPVHLWTIASAGGEARRLTSGHWSVSGNSLAWTPAGDRIAFVSQPSSGTRDSDKRSVEMIDASGGSPAPITGIVGRRCSQPSFSPDGRWLGVSCPVDGQVKNQTELLILPAAGGEFKRVSAPLDRDFARVIWTADSKALIGTAPDGTFSGLWTIPVNGPALRWQLGKVCVSGQGELDVARDGRIVMIGTEPQRPSELYLLSTPQSAIVRATDLNAEVSALKLGQMESLFWKSDDGLQLSGVLSFPPGFDPSKKYPLLLNIHGGPWGSSHETFSERSQLFAGRGWIVFEPNYRGSNNEGNALYSAVYRDHGAGPGRDVMAGLSELKKRPYIDQTRIGVSGWSYGGYMTTWLIGHYQGWKAAMAGAAVIDLEDDYNLNDLRLFTRAFSDTLTTPMDHELMIEQSPITYVDRMKAPLLMISDTGDMRVPVTQSYKLFHALRERGQEVRMFLYPVPGHFPADPYRIRDIDQRWMEWFADRLK
jgi:dipeptidyl aminopeptidase/acylaminoacyl peptidase